MKDGLWSVLMALGALMVLSVILWTGYMIGSREAKPKPCIAFHEVKDEIHSDCKIHVTTTNLSTGEVQHFESPCEWRQGK
jgi:hypothetical protein